VEKTLSGIDDVRATVNFATGKAIVTASASVPVQQLIEQVQQAGYGAQVVAPGWAGTADADHDSADASRVSYLWRRLLVALSPLCSAV